MQIGTLIEYTLTEYPLYFYSDDGAFLTIALPKMVVPFLNIDTFAWQSNAILNCYCLFYMVILYCIGFYFLNVSVFGCTGGLHNVDQRETGASKALFYNNML